MVLQDENDSDLLAIFENAPIIMLLVDEERRVRRSNKMAQERTSRENEQMVGLRAGEALKCIHSTDHVAGCGFGDYCHDCTIRKTIVDTFSTGKSYRHITAPVHLNGDDGSTELYVLLSTTLLNMSGNKMVLTCLEDITDLKHAEEAVRKSEEKWASLVDNAPDFISTVDRNHMIEFINHPVPGLERSDVTGKSVYDFILPEYHEIARKCIDHVFKTSDCCSYVATATGPDGSVAWYQNQLGPIVIDGEVTGVSIFGTDVTERKQSEEATLQSEERYALAQRAANIGSWDWSILSGDLKWSDTIEPMFGFNRGEFGATYEAFLDCVHPDDRWHVENSINVALEEDVDYDIEHRITWPDGTVRWLSETGDVIRDETGKAVRMIGIVQDITERKKVDQLKDEFIGLVSHELRSPLTVIIGAINTALSESEYLSPEETNGLLQDASLEAETLSHLIGNLLELSRSQASRLLLYPEPINIQDVAELVVESIRRQSPSHRFTVDFAPEIPPVRADQLRIERVFYNLLENATKYSPENSETRILASLEVDYIVIGVTDQGEGISLEDQENLFDSFHRLQRHELAGITGTGLGLSVCRILVEAHGGNIWVTSELGASSTFFFSLPWR